MDAWSRCSAAAGRWRASYIRAPGRNAGRRWDRRMRRTAASGRASGGPPAGRPSWCSPSQSQARRRRWRRVSMEGRFRRSRCPGRRRILVIYRFLQASEATGLPRRSLRVPARASPARSASGRGPRQFHRPHGPRIRVIYRSLQVPQVPGLPRRPPMAEGRASTGRFPPAPGPRHLFHVPPRPHIRAIYRFLQVPEALRVPRRRPAAPARASPATSALSGRPRAP